MVEDHRSYCHFGCWEFMSTGLGLEQMLSGSVPKPGGGGTENQGSDLLFSSALTYEGS